MVRCDTPVPACHVAESRIVSPPLSDRVASVRDMNSIAFVPASRALFIADAASESSGEQPHALLSRLRTHGWPTQARLLLPGTELAFRNASGVMVELIDALPILASPTAQSELQDSRELQALSKLLQLALSLTERGQAWPKVTRLGTGSRYVARWKAGPTPRERLELQQLGKDLRVVLAELPSTPLSQERWQSVVSGHRIASLLLDATIDLLVREGSRRGAQVRLADRPASAWEQRLVHALSDDRALMLASSPSDEVFARQCEELNAWSQTALTGAARPLLPSPVSWQAGENLQQVTARMLRQSSLLAAVLLSGQAAPRMLPTTAWQTAVPTVPPKLAPVPRMLLDEALSLLREQRPRTTRRQKEHSQAA